MNILKQGDTKKFEAVDMVDNLIILLRNNITLDSETIKRAEELGINVQFMIKYVGEVYAERHEEDEEYV